MGRTPKAEERHIHDGDLRQPNPIAGLDVWDQGAETGVYDTGEGDGIIRGENLELDVLHPQLLLRDLFLLGGYRRCGINVCRRQFLFTFCHVCTIQSARSAGVVWFRKGIMDGWEDKVLYGLQRCAGGCPRLV